MFQQREITSTAVAEAKGKVIVSEYVVWGSTDQCKRMMMRMMMSRRTRSAPMIISSRTHHHGIATLNGLSLLPSCEPSPPSATPSGD